MTNTKTMLQAQVAAWGEPPKAVAISIPPPPSNPNEFQIRVEAVGVHRVVRSRAAGKHYSTKTAPLPHIPGIDGVGRRVSDNKLVYFFTWTHGTLGEYITLPTSSVHEIPRGEEQDPVHIASVINPAMSSWMAFQTRVSNLPSNFTALILGATSASGKIAIEIARAVGAKSVIGAARNSQALEALPLDRRIVINSDDVTQTDFSDLDDVDVIIDYVYGDLTKHLFSSLKTPKPVQYVQIGQLAMQDLNLSGAILRGKDLTIRGAGAGAWKVEEFVKTVPKLLELVGKLPKEGVRVEKLEDVEKAWSYAGPERLVIVP